SGRGASDRWWEMVGSGGSGAERSDAGRLVSWRTSRGEVVGLETLSQNGARVAIGLTSAPDCHSRHSSPAISLPLARHKSTTPLASPTHVSPAPTAITSTTNRLFPFLPHRLPAPRPTSRPAQAPPLTVCLALVATGALSPRPRSCPRCRGRAAPARLVRPAGPLSLVRPHPCRALLPTPVVLAVIDPSTVSPSRSRPRPCALPPLSKDGCARSTKRMRRGIRVVSGAPINRVPRVAFRPLPLHGRVVEDGEGAETARKMAQ
ncbi:hypothetical protein FRC08_013475, partial [Ceratobasidium sp. 394]